LDIRKKDVSMPLERMTLNDLAVCMRGMPRDSLILIDTPDGPKRMRSVRGGYGNRDGELLPLGASAQGDAQYVLIFST
jgi:hypothetical protein